MRGIVGYGAYIPHHRLSRQVIAEALGQKGRPGTRAVASFDEDSTSMAVEAGRLALASAGGGASIADVYLATTSPPYLDKTNATALRAALGLSDEGGAFDMVGGTRSGAGALIAGMNSARPTLVALSDVRTGLPGGADEHEGGNGAAAFIVGDVDEETPLVAELVSRRSVSDEFLDRWRVPGDAHSNQWEERFGEHAYVPLGAAALKAALLDLGTSPDKLTRVLVSGSHQRAVAKVAATSGASGEALGDNFASSIGNAGAAQPGILLAAALDTAEAGDLIALVVLADGADAFILRATEHLAARRSPRPVAAQIAAGSGSIRYADYLSWRGLLRREPPRRPDPDRPAAPASLRKERWKFGFDASRCDVCGSRHLPPQRVCRTCGATDQSTLERLADAVGTITTFTVDHLAFSLNPPVMAAVVDFEGGGRLQCELTDVDADAIALGDRVEMTFRRLHTADGIHNYFWKARPYSGGTHT